VGPVGIDWLAQTTDPQVPRCLLMTHHGAVAYPDEVAGSMQALLSMWAFTFTRMQEVTQVSVQELSEVSKKLADQLQAKEDGDAAPPSPG